MGDDAKFETWLSTTAALLVSLGNRCGQPSSIPVVPDELRKWNEKAYEPKVISMGPRYKGRRELLPMEDIKWRCMRCLLTRVVNTRIQEDLKSCVKKCMQYMLEHDAAVRASYEEEIKLDSFDLAEIMLYDGCFLLELLSYHRPN